MIIDLHIHSKDCSDGNMTLSQIFREAKRRDIGMLSITDHDAIHCQGEAVELAKKYEIKYITGVELNISFSHPKYRDSKAVSLDVLGYCYDINNKPLQAKLKAVRHYRRERAERILQKINTELLKEKRDLFTQHDLKAIEQTVDGSFGRPHIANYMIKKGLVSTKQEAFDRYLVKCNIPKMPVSLEEASSLIRGAGGKLVLAHPNDPNGTSLISLTSSIREQQRIIMDTMGSYLDGIECFHSRHCQETSDAYVKFADKEGFLATGGSDCHQKPILMGTVHIPHFIANQFGIKHKVW